MSGSPNGGGGETFLAFPAHAQFAILRIWQEAHDRGSCITSHNPLSKHRLFLVDEIKDALKNDDYVLGLFRDFSKAFAIVNHDILLDHLCLSGIAEFLSSG